MLPDDPRDLRPSDRTMLCPPPLRPGDAIRVIAPSSPFNKTLGWRGLGWLSEHFRVRFDHGLLAEHEFLAGTDERRRDELSRALHESDVRAVVAMRGGYGAGRIAHEIDWSQLRSDPKWLVGFSDITALHLEAQAVGVMSMHGTMVAQLGRTDMRLRVQWLRSLEHPEKQKVFSSLQAHRAGDVVGTLVGGNLTVFHGCVTAGRFKAPKSGFVLFLEDIAERTYRIDRMLTSLLVGGHLRGLVGVVLGQFSGCAASSRGHRTAEQVIADVLAPLHVPIASGLPVGHENWHEPLILGARAHLHVGNARAELVVSTRFG